jgi:hypothetical protein
MRRAPCSAARFSRARQTDTKKNQFDDNRDVRPRGRQCAYRRGRRQTNHGEGTVTVRSPVRARHHATIGAPFEGTPMGQCVTRAFVNMIIPPFEGADVDLTYQVNLKPDAKRAKKDSAKPKK